MFLTLGYALGVGIFSKNVVFSEISNAGITCKGYEARRPTLYIRRAVIVIPLCGKFNVTIS